MTGKKQTTSQGNMYYKKFSIYKYKGINELSLELASKGGVVTLIGLNESGKTTVLEAISTFFNILKENQEFTEENFEKIIPRSEIASFSDTIKIVADIMIEDTDALPIHRNQECIKLCLSIKFEKGKHDMYEFDVQDSKGLLLQTENDSNNNELIEKLADKLPNIYYYDDFLETIPDSISYYKVDYEKNNGGIESENYYSDLKWGKVLNEVFSGANTSENFFSVISDFDFEENKKSIDGKIAKMGRYLTDEISSLWKELTGKNYQFKEIVIEDERKINLQQNDAPQIKEAISKKSQIIVKSGQNVKFISIKEIKICIKVKNKDNSKFDIEERSKGCRWFFSFLLFTYFRKRNSCLFLLDEPGSNLHGLIQESICNKAFSELSKSCCVIYSTHSPYLINMDYAKSIYIVSNEQKMELEDGSSIIKIQPYSQLIKNPDVSKDPHIKLLLDHISFKLPSILNDKVKFNQFQEKMIKSAKNLDIGTKDQIKNWLNKNHKNLPNFLYKVLMAALAGASI